MKKGLFSIYLILALIVTMLPINVFAQEDVLPVDEGRSISQIEFEIEPAAGQRLESITGSLEDMTIEGSEYTLVVPSLLKTATNLKFQVEWSAPRTGANDTYGVYAVYEYIEKKDDGSEIKNPREVDLSDGGLTELPDGLSAKENKLTIQLIKNKGEDSEAVLEQYIINIKTQQVLQSLTLKDERGNTRDIAPQFSYKTLEYAADIPQSIGSITVNTTAAGDATVTVGTQLGSRVEIKPEWDSNGEMTIPITVEKDGDIPTTYRLKLKRIEFDYYPYFEQDLDTTKREYTQFDQVTEPLAVKVHAEGDGKLSYQWKCGMKPNQNRPVPVTAGKEDDPAYNGKGAEFYPSTANANTPRDQYYSCQVTYTVNGKTYTIKSKAVQVVIKAVTAATPVITEQPKAESAYTQGVEAEILSVKATRADSGNLTYQWYEKKSAEAKDGTPIEGAVNNWFRPSTAEEGDHYYYCKVTNSIQTVSATVDSDIAKVTVTPLSTEFTKGGDGTEESPFILEDLSDLKKLQQLVNSGNSMAGVCFKMTNSIALDSDWTPIGALRDGEKETKNGINILPFAGTFNGANNEVKVAKGGKPLFGYVREATIENLKISGEEINGYGLVDKYTVDYGNDGNYNTGVPKGPTIRNVTLLNGTSTKRSGLIGGYASGGNTVTIENCIIEKGVTIGYDGSQSGIGSFAGLLNGTIVGCKSSATVKGTGRVGGLAGVKGQSMGQCQILNSSFDGTVIADGEYVGGIIGSGYDGSGTAPNTPVVTVQNCYVSGTLTGADYIGGIIGGEPGCECCWENGAGSISNNAFYGKIHVTGAGKAVGGIVGFLKSYNKYQGIENNYFLNDCGAAKGIGNVETIITKSHKVYGSKFGIDGTFDAEKFCSNKSEDEFKNGIVVTALNQGDKSYKNWVSGTDSSYPQLSKDPVVYKLELGDTHKTDYKVGESFDKSGMEVIAFMSNGVTKNVTNEVSFEGFDTSARGTKTVYVKYSGIDGVAITNFNIRVTYEAPKDIQVKFALYGDRVHGDNGTKHTLSNNDLEPWIPMKSYTIDENYTVADLLNLVSKEEGVIFSNPTGNYVDSVTWKGTTLSEFDNGKLSGWMYTLNKAHPLLGVKEQFLNSGDEIVFHYTDDYTKEEGSDKWNTPADGEVSEVITTGSSGSATTTTPTQVAVSGSTATATVKAEHVTELLKQAKENKSEEIVMQVAASASKGAETVKLQLDVSAVNSIVNTTSAVVTVSTENGNVTLDREILKQAVSEGNGSTITLEVVKPKNVTAEQKKAAGENAYIIQLVLKSGGKTISAFNKGQATVKVEVPTRLLDKKVAAVHIGDGSVLEQLAGKLLTEGTKKYYEFTTPHFSTFALVDADEEGLEVTDDEQAKLEKLISGVKNTKLKAHSARTSKGIKITWTKSKGYKMDYYEIFRSTKRSKGYGKKAFFSTKSTKNPAKQRYTNTKNLKKGTRYYYKVRGVRVLDGKKYYSQWSTKTWRTA